MKIQILKENLEKGVSTVQSFIPSKTTLPILGNIAIETAGDKIIFKATDLDISIKTGTPCTVLEEGAITVPGKKFTEIVRELPNTMIDIELENDVFTIRSESGVYKILGVSIDEFPRFPEIEKEQQFEIEPYYLKRMINKTLFAVSTDESRPELNGIYWEIFSDETRMVSTDGRRLAKIKLKKDFPNIEEELGIIIPTKALSYLSRINDGGDENNVQIYLDKSYVVFEFDDTTIFSRLIDATFPDYEQVIPMSNDKQLIVDKNEIISALRRISILANAQNHQIAMELSPEKVKLRTNTPDIGEGDEEIEAEYDNEEMEIGYNANYLLDAFRNIDSDNIILEFSSSLSAGLIKPEVQKENEHYISLVMPLRL
jgi:DNA polymerase-3 subunit beta